MKELTRSLALNRIEILRKTNLQPGNEEIKVKIRWPRRVTVQYYF